MAKGKVPAGKPYSVTLSAPPKITGCTDTLGGSDTIKDTGTWTLSVSKSKPYKMTLTIPKKGATFSSNVLSSCKITAAPNKPDPVTGSYDGKSTDTVKNAAIPTSGSGCSSSTASTSATVVLSPAPGAPPF